jgi:hypothetical protein
MKIMRERGLDRMADLGVQPQGITIPGPGGALEARIYRSPTRPR